MNLLLIETMEIQRDGVARITGRRAAHLLRVLRVGVGSQVRAGIVDGAVGIATVAAIDDTAGAVTLDVGAIVAAAPPPRPPAVDVVLAVPRPKALSRTVQTLAALGVARVDLVNAWRVDASYFTSPRLERDALAEDVRLGAEQGTTTRLPEIAVHRLLVPYLEEVLAPRLAAAVAPTSASPSAAAPRRLLAHPRATLALEHALPPGDAAPVVLAIGPEGGWIDRELDSFVALGFAAVTLGDAVLRTENAVAAALAQVALLRRLSPP